jgi:hypothetical protein
MEKIFLTLCLEVDGETDPVFEIVLVTERVIPKVGNVDGVCDGDGVGVDVVVAVTDEVAVNEGVGDVVAVADCDLEGFADREPLFDGVADLLSLTLFETDLVPVREPVAERETDLLSETVSLTVGVTVDEGETGEGVRLAVADLLGVRLVEGVDEGVPPDEGVGVCVGLGEDVPDFVLELEPDAVTVDVIDEVPELVGVKDFVGELVLVTVELGLPEPDFEVVAVREPV